LYFDPSLVPTVGLYKVAYGYSDPNTSCFASDTIAFNVLIVPVVSAGNDTTVCGNSNPMLLVGSPIGGQWTISSGNALQNGVFYPQLAQVGNYTLYADNDGHENQWSGDGVKED
jgi:hypothetical protein